MMFESTTRARMIVSTVLCALALGVGGGATQPAGPFDVVLAGGRVIDPASGLDGVRHVGIRGGTIAAVSAAPLKGTTTLTSAASSSRRASSIHMRTGRRWRAIATRRGMA
jgi:hypothetical protein